MYSGRFKSVDVQHEAGLQEMIEYVERTFVVRGFVKQAEETTWCYARARSLTCSDRIAICALPIYCGDYLGTTHVT